MFAELSVVPVMSEDELREALEQYKQEHYADSRIYMPRLDELERCIRWMGCNSNAQFMNSDIAKLIIDNDEDTHLWMTHVFERMKSSAQLYVQLRHFQLGLNVMSRGSLEACLSELTEFHTHLNLGGIFTIQKEG